MKTAAILCGLLLALLKAEANGEHTEGYYVQDGGHVRFIRQEPTLQHIEELPHGDGAELRAEVTGETSLLDNTQAVDMRGEQVQGTTFEDDPQSVGLRGEQVEGTTFEDDPQTVGLRGEQVEGTTFEDDPQTVGLRGEQVEGTTFEDDPQTVGLRGEEIEDTAFEAAPQTVDPRGEEVGGNTWVANDQTQGSEELPWQNGLPTTDVRTDDAPVPEEILDQGDLEKPAEGGSNGVARSDDQINDAEDNNRAANPGKVNAKAKTSTNQKHSSSPTPSFPTQPADTWGLTAMGCPPCWSWVLGWYIPPWCKSCSVSWPWLCWLCNWYKGFWWCPYC